MVACIRRTFSADKLAFKYAVYLFARLIDFANINVKVMMIFENTSPDTQILINISLKNTFISRDKISIKTDKRNMVTCIRRTFSADKLAFKYAVYLFARLIDFANINVKVMMIFENTLPDTQILIYIS